MPRILSLSLLIAALTVLGGCSSLHFPGVYRIDIPQGNVVTPSMLQRLEPGMTPDQVRFVLGPPTLTDPFTPNTWFYLLDYRKGDGDTVRQKIVVHFDAGRYTHYEGKALKDVREQTAGSKDRALESKASDERQAAADDDQSQDQDQEQGQDQNGDQQTAP